MTTQERTAKYKEYIVSKEWYNLKVDLLEMRGCKCEQCGKVKDPRRLHIHHITYDRLFNELASDLQILCPICHMKEHGLIKEKPAKPKYKKAVKNNPPKKKPESKAVLAVKKKYKNGFYYSVGAYKKALKAASKYT